jgi:hypothetical protein
MAIKLESIIFGLGISMYIAMPVVLVWGWVRWKKRTQPRTLCSTLSLIGFSLATLSGLLAILTVFYAIAIPFRFYDPSLLRIYRWGLLLSLTGFLFAISGVWRANPLRWYAPAGAVGMFLFWFVAASGE